MFNDNENPYAPPSCPGCGEYDWTLFRRILYTLSVIAMLYLGIAAAASYHDFARIHPGRTDLRQIWDFMHEWNRAPVN